MDNNIFQPILRHPDLIRTLLRYPNREFTILELSKEAKVPYTTAWRLIQKLAKAGLVLTKGIGKSTVCTLNRKSPFLEQVKSILPANPHRAALNEFLKLIKSYPKIKRVILFGSLAKGAEKPESDVDVAIIVEKETNEFEDRLNQAVDDILKIARIKIVPLVFTLKALKEKEHFKKEIEQGEIIYERT